MHVDRCVCHNRTLAELRSLAAAQSLDAAALSQSTGCGASCTLCLPYIRLMLATGETVIPLMSPDEIERRIASRTDGVPPRAP